MGIIKKTKDRIAKFLIGQSVVPRGLIDLAGYFRHFGSINFRYERNENGIVAISTNFRYGSIVTSGKSEEELDKNIKDAILTSFEIPSSYAKEANVNKVGDGVKGEYALA